MKIKVAKYGTPKKIVKIKNLFITKTEEAYTINNITEMLTEQTYPKIYLIKTYS
jgi:hypothetical protein